jgi:hypothetical protein
MVTKYYVYALIDPNTNQIFYIGKGSGSRYKSHAKATLKSGSNIAKYLKIHEIQNEGLEIKTEILYPYLNEEDALLLEKIMIYMLGRKALGEGGLLNVVPGGKWKPGDSIFYEEDFTPNFDDSCLDFVARERFYSFTAIADFSYLGAPVKKQKIYVYDFNGKLISADSLSCWFKELSSTIY